MRIFILTMEDPVYTLPFLKEVMEQRRSDIVGVAVAKGGRLKIGKKRSKLAYLCALVLIMGLPYFIKHSWTTVFFGLKKKLSGKIGFIKSPSIVRYAEEMGIPTYSTSNPNKPEFLSILKEAQPDIIIQQSQHIIKKSLLEIPKLGTLNRHNALLPKNRGRLTPFWVLFKGETQTGVSIHFVEEGLDSGEIIVQEKYDVLPQDTFNSLVKKNYEIAPKAMLKAIDKLEKGSNDFMPNEDDAATYNSTPTLKDAWRYRIGKKMETHNS